MCGGSGSSPEPDLAAGPSTVTRWDAFSPAFQVIHTVQEGQLLATAMPYDISIWEEIRSTVRWKTDQLVKKINEEIPRDLSLAEFHSKEPIPWQLREIMEQRANAWVQRVYHLCCEARKDCGKGASADFDRAVWAYWIDPFIMVDKESDVHDPTMSGFLNLLLCAVGSPPGKRHLLKVSQKNCCLDVRGKIHGTWFYKLHHLRSPIDEAVAALSRHKALEARAARIAAGLPPDPPPPLTPAPAPPLAQPAAPVSPQATPVPSPATVPVQGDAAAELLEGSKGDAQTISSATGAATWEDIEILFLSDERVQIRNGTNRETRNYAEFGFADGRTGTPNQAWETLRALAEQGGTIQVARAGSSWPKVEKRIQEIRKVLQKRFGLSADPIPFLSGVGYKACFKINCGPSFNS